MMQPPLRPLPTNASLKFVSVNGVELAVLDIAASGTEIGVVHLVHGFTGSKEDFWELAPLIAQHGYRVIAHDHRGQNQSGHVAADEYTLPLIASDAREVERVLGIVQPHVLGHSFGGLVAREMVLQFPSDFVSLTLLCTGPGRVSPLADGIKRMQAFLRSRTMAEAWTQLMANPDPSIPVQPDSDPESVYSRRWNNSDSASVIAQVDILCNEPDRVDALAATGIACHVVYGEFDDAWPLAEQDLMAQRLNAPRSIIPAAGHCPNEQFPQVTADVLTTYWDAR